MKKLKKLTFSIMLVALVFVAGINMVDAKSYTAYTAGDEITVNLNDTTTGKFYVIKDSTATDTSVKAIYKDIVDSDINYGKVNYSDATTKITELSSKWTNVADIVLPTMQDLFGDDVDLSTGSFHFTEPTYVLSSLSYWTSTTGITEEKQGYWNVGTTLDGEGTTGVFDVTNTAGVKPLITVGKNYVVGGVTEAEAEEDTLWESFVEKYKTTELMKNLDDGTITVTSTDNSLTVVASDGTDVVTVNFTYANGIITYVPSVDKTTINMNNAQLFMVEDILVMNSLYALADLKNYDIDVVDAWLDEEKTFTLENDGISYETYEYKEESNEDGVSSSVSIETVTSLKLDLKNGLKISNGVEEPKEEVTENPDTGIFNQYGLVIAIIVGVGALSYVSTRKHSKFPQA